MSYEPAVPREGLGRFAVVIPRHGFDCALRGSGLNLAVLHGVGRPVGEMNRGDAASRRGFDWLPLSIPFSKN